MCSILQIKSTYKLDSNQMKVYPRSAIRGYVFDTHADMIYTAQEPMYYIRYSNKYYNVDCSTYVQSDNGKYIKMLGSDGRFYFTQHEWIKDFNNDALMLNFSTHTFSGVIPYIT